MRQSVNIPISGLNCEENLNDIILSHFLSLHYEMFIYSFTYLDVDDRRHSEEIKFSRCW